MLNEFPYCTNKKYRKPTGSEGGRWNTIRQPIEVYIQSLFSKFKRMKCDERKDLHCKMTIDGIKEKNFPIGNL